MCQISFYCHVKMEHLKLRFKNEKSLSSFINPLVKAHLRIKKEMKLLF